MGRARTDCQGSPGAHPVPSALHAVLTTWTAITQPRVTNEEGEIGAVK